jgi:phenylpropionate dioxygenase-like ring-hydroxylating dioxygenase large terminal subunit
LYKKYKYKEVKMPKQEFPFPMPNGWFCISRSHELENGELKSIKFCENDVAAFRTESGKVSVLDAYCGYSGINLGISGHVEGENLVCPKHGIKWSVNGLCAEIEEKSIVPESAKNIQMFNYPVVEVNGFIWAWHHLHKQEPEWEVPAIEGFNGDDEKWGKTYYYDYNINTVLQEIAENDVDQAHFPKVHGSPSLPETEAITEGIYKKTIAETLMDPNNDSVSEEHKVEDHGMFTTTFTRESWGLGTVGLKMINLPPSGGEFIMVNASCPVDNSNSILRWSMRVSKDIEDELGMAIIDGIANGVLDDMPIWDHKSYVADPILCDGDGPINKFRKWVSQFYSEPIQN